MKQFILGTAILFILFFSSCTKESKKRKEVSIAYANAMAKQDYETAKKYCTEESKKSIDWVKGMIEAPENKQKIQGPKYAFVSETLSDNTAIVKLKEIDSTAKEIEIVLKKINGEWLVSIEKPRFRLDK
ncbi:MAG: DUF4878 domain-containing protein [Bacteroidia bacterium]|nr:DUF4878 domain-containing protein [Bacteroidia bacterium]MDW8348266.1 DUF4878 domain-containing protein [Bacteroidia bacterium]